MGKKTDKKIKSERINALKKQYDSFLEEDKKRKERNDYILGKLDKMRYNNMTVQLHQTPTTYRDFVPPSISRHPYQAEKLEPTTVDRINTMQLIHANQPISRPGYQSSQFDIPTNYLEEASFLNEISKKYILIPKLKNTFPNACLEAISSPVAEPVSSIMPDIDSNDWKSKYEILKQLKSKEKEEEIPKCASQEPKNYNQEDIITTYANEIPVKDVTDEVGIELDLKKNCVLSEKNDQIQVSDGCRDLNADSFAQSDIFYRNDNDLGQKIEHGLQVAEYAIACEQNVQGLANNDNTAKHQNSNPQEEYAKGDSNYENSVGYKKSNAEQEYVQEVLTNHNTVENQKTYPNQEYVQEVSNNDNTVEYQNSYPEQEYPIEYEQFIPEQVNNINPTEQVKAFETNNVYSTKKPTYSPDEAAILEYDRVPTSATRIISSTVADMVDGNIAAEITPINSDAFEAGIEEFDTEQRELFDPQIADENYTHYEQDGTYNAEYSQEQNYPQSQQYAYYEGTEQEFQPVEINEHEETQQDYDPAYEQQYTSTYDQTQGEQQQHVYMEPDPQQLPEPNYDLNQLQDFEALTSYGPQETVANVEETLAKEEGLTDTCAEEDPTVLTET